MPTCLRLRVCKSHSVHDFRGNLPAACNGLGASRARLPGLLSIGWRCLKAATGAGYPRPVAARLGSAASACASQCKQSLRALSKRGREASPFLRARGTESEGRKSVVFWSPSSVSTRFFLGKIGPHFCFPSILTRCPFSSVSCRLLAVAPKSLGPVGISSARSLQIPPPRWL